MRRILPLILIVGLTSASFAEESESGGEGLSLMERGARLFMEGILREMEPALDELQGFADDLGPSLRSFAAEMGPALRELLQEVEDWSAYEKPEMLDNGDIIIRRKRPETPEEGGNQIEL